MTKFPYPMQTHVDCSKVHKVLTYSVSFLILHADSNIENH